MKPYKDMNLQELRAERVRLEEILKTFKDKNLNLLIARGIPSAEKVEVSNEMLDVINSKTVNISSDGVDCRNYGGGLTGIAEAKELFSEYLGVGADEIMVAGNSSMGIIGEILAHSIRKGVLGSTKPWSAYPKIKFLCPVPGYDRHFGFCEYFDIEMIPVPLGEEGPDMDIVEKLAAEDETIKGMWCVPKYSNPSGISYSDETIRRLANMKTAADDFRIFYDNAYAVHYVYKMVEILNILEECKKAGNPNRVYMFGSTSKMTFPGAGVALFAASKENIEHVIKGMSAMWTGWDKINMLRHARFLKNKENIMRIMSRHAAILRPRFDIVINAIERELVPAGAGDCIRPDGGYFVMYRAPNGCAKAIFDTCKECGVTVTTAGATHPYGKDPDDTYLRIAPSAASLSVLDEAMQIFCAAAKFVTVNKQISALIGA